MSLKVTTEDLLDGMVLAELVVNNYGQTLLQNCGVLNTKHQQLINEDADCVNLDRKQVRCYF